MAAIAAVPITTLSGSSPTRRTIQRMNGSKRPASFITPKKTTAKARSAAVGATLRMPSMAKLPISPAKPPAIAATTGTSVRATTTDVTRKRISPTSVAMAATPRRVSIGSYARPRLRPISSVCCPSAGGGSSGSTGAADSLTGFPGTRTDAAPAGISTSMFRAAS